MPKIKKSLLDGFEEDGAESEKVRCLACKAASSDGKGTWMLRRSAAKHILGPVHLSVIAAATEASQLAREDASRLEEPYCDPSDAYINPRAADLATPELQFGLFDPALDGMPDLGPCSDDKDGFAGVHTPIPTGMLPHDPSIEETRLREQVHALLMQAEQDDEFGGLADSENDSTITNIVEQFGLLDLDDSAADTVESVTENPAANRGYAPYPSKMIAHTNYKMMLLDIIDNLPRLRMSSSQFKMILWTLRESGVKNTPSYSSFRKMQQQLQMLCGSEPKAHVSSLGNIFYVNDIRESIARDFANPEIAKHLHFYPKETSGPVAEVWQAEHWTEFDPSERTPMYVQGLKQYFVNEVAQLGTGSYVLPLSWITRDGRLCIDCHDVTVLSDLSWLVGEEVRNVDADLLKHNYFEVLEQHGGSIMWSADNEELYVVMVPIWCDNVSGNLSKQYNKHINIYMANLNLPKRLLQQEYFVRFVSTSPHATSSEQFSVDNPQQAEEASQMGGGANCKCRKCKAGPARSASETRQELNNQIGQAMYGIEKTVVDMQTASGTKDKIAQHWINILIARSREMKLNRPGRPIDEIVSELCSWFESQPGKKMNPLLSVQGLDPTQDTPVEILHTVLLGIVKYVWYNLHSNWKESQRDLFVVRLQSTDLDGLTIPPIRAAYMMQYCNGLIGKHFKSLMQTMVFHVHGLVSPEQFSLIKAIGALGAMLWIPEIEKMVDYLIDMEVLVANVLDAFGSVDPTKIIVKMKLQILPHIMDDIRRHSPLIGKSTEIFECFNAIFRMCSVLIKQPSSSKPRHCHKIGIYGSSQAHFERRILAGWQDMDSTQASRYVGSISGPLFPFWRAGGGLVSGRIAEIILSDGAAEGFITVQHYTIGSTLHPDFDMPILRKPSEGSLSVAVHPKAVLFRFSAQHDCRLGGCLPSLTRPEVQERQPTGRTAQLIGHTDDLYFVLNTHTLHNTTLLRKVLPPHLTKPTLLFPDGQARHYEIAAKLRLMQASKRAAAKTKRAATAKSNLAKKAAAKAGDQGDVGTAGADGSGPEE
ncbi:hypothetical protein FIBSPDRAFT_899076 [Athelia psychrophila]|uniref:Uncharacterized protein n=1 Tax=Athelia psychrophila TaxID=1759441 RepID=A0A166A650_9AGAM|nr:hypothetical protein FIBSPDRAFT_899076 [Fibularhizoctonia sp. CBS 109695]